MNGKQLLDFIVVPKKIVEALLTQNVANVKNTTEVFNLPY